MGTPAPDAVTRLVDRFDRDRKVFQSLDYREEQLRAEFLNPFFESLGWDVSNKAGLTEVFRPVIHEESIKACPELGRRVAGATKAPDYTFRIGGRRRRVGLTPAALSGTTCPCPSRLNRTPH
jgi:hypothetical protein